MQRLEVSGAVRHIYIYIIRRLKVKDVHATSYYTPPLKAFTHKYIDCSNVRPWKQKSSGEAMQRVRNP